MSRGSILAALIAGLGLVAAGCAATPQVIDDRALAENPQWRSYITSRIADLQAIHTPEGISELEELEVNGSRQWISVRGLNRENPVLLFIHGGPASPTIATAWAWQKPLEDYFTVVQWDQRAVGKNAVSADRASLAGTMSLDQHVDDAEVIAEHVARKLGKEKIFVMGWSWGSGIGIDLAVRRPDLLYAYIGLGQSARDGGGSSERAVFDGTMARARAAGNTVAIEELEALEPQLGTGPSFERALAIRKWARMYNGGWYGKPDLDLYFALPAWGPEYTSEDVAIQTEATRWAMDNLERAPERSDVNLTKFEVPVFILMGRWDLHTPYVSAVRYFNSIEAPSKKLITFERSGHFSMMEEPGKFLVTLVEEVLPLAGPRVEFEPETPAQ